MKFTRSFSIITLILLCVTVCPVFAKAPTHSENRLCLRTGRRSGHLSDESRRQQKDESDASSRR